MDLRKTGQGSKIDQARFKWKVYGVLDIYHPHYFKRPHCARHNLTTNFDNCQATMNKYSPLKHEHCKIPSTTKNVHT